MGVGWEGAQVKVRRGKEGIREVHGGEERVGLRLRKTGALHGAGKAPSLPDQPHMCIRPARRRC